ncbi:hypothetical protein ACFZB4_43105 [Streptomyces pseudovenezuelae]|uniref:hypothetical protein n=1 Tax=Streptomyces pseudovenezuelae TaxID=67350 RepID=UPI0036E3C641
MNSPNTSPGLISTAIAQAAAVGGSTTPAWAIWVTWTVTGLAAVAGVIGVWRLILHRRRDARAKRLEPGYAATRSTLIVLNRLIGTSAVIDVTDELKELTDLLTDLAIAEACSPDVPFGLVVAELGHYLECALPSDYSAQVAADLSLLDGYLTLARRQGIKLEATRAAIATVQRRIEKLTQK